MKGKMDRIGRHNSERLQLLLNEWMLGDEQEQSETFETLRHALDEERAEGYKLFP